MSSAYGGCASEPTPGGDQDEPAAPAQDADGIQDGVYVGEVYTTTRPDVPV